MHKDTNAITQRHIEMRKNEKKKSITAAFIRHSY